MYNSPEIENLIRKARIIRQETLRLHKISSKTRIASSLSPVELLTVLFYGGYIKFNPHNPLWEGRDRFIVSKGHGSISLYPILSDLGFFPSSELDRIGQKGALLGTIPDPNIPGYETINGSLGHGPGVGAGIALGLKSRKQSARTIVLIGDGELYEGAVWEALMLASHHRLNNLFLILDYNKTSMLDRCENIISHENIEARFSAFGWKVFRSDGHDIAKLIQVFNDMFNGNEGSPKVLIADTIKGKGVPELESDHLCHIKSLKPERIAELLQRSDL